MNVNIQPFTGPQTTCPKCGNGPSPQARAFVSPIIGGSLLRARYCPGGKEPEETEENPLTAFMHLIAAESITSKFRSLTLKRINICAGIGEDHLHVTCVDCGYEWLMQTKEHQGKVHPIGAA